MKDQKRALAEEWRSGGSAPEKLRQGALVRAEHHDPYRGPATGCPWQGTSGFATPGGELPSRITGPPR